MSLLRSIQTGSESNHAHDSIGKRINWPGREVNHLAPAGAEVNS
jgi:hypothetical protein